ncbi:hypothetical protein HMPREF9555_00887 [Selenomonas artemidis F0399]|uniref:Uncharacterized protein n=1 Tax=Selenomonas artemidis F0399 TaxID=749551 RepID=E7N1Q3_9FIRM|nr:hypothetical protein HMPREF9555_00887 [Selenomonas artemidis F0399]
MFYIIPFLNRFSYGNNRWNVREKNGQQPFRRLSAVFIALRV